ncbi:MAG: putative rRNA maturation factor [Gammaproteobacteria bacterium]|jgi:probable rRNA maturation factor
MAIETHVTVQFATDLDAPPASEIVKWATLALETKMSRPCELTVRVVGDKEGRHLNEHWRMGDGPTNVLAFPMEGLELEPPLLGDVVICASVANSEAMRDGKENHTHWAHLVIHGTLHLLGYDHLTDSEAADMEAQECTLMRELGYRDPYL